MQLTNLAQLANRAIYFTFRNFFLFIFYCLLDQFSRFFHQMEGNAWIFSIRYSFSNSLRDVAMVVADLFARSQSITGSAEPILTIFSLYSRYWIADDQSNVLFPIS